MKNVGLLRFIAKALALGLVVLGALALYARFRHPHDFVGYWARDGFGGGGVRLAVFDDGNAFVVDPAGGDVRRVRIKADAEALATLAREAGYFGLPKRVGSTSGLTDPPGRHYWIVSGSDARHVQEIGASPALESLRRALEDLVQQALAHGESVGSVEVREACEAHHDNGENMVTGPCGVLLGERDWGTTY